MVKLPHIPNAVLDMQLTGGDLLAQCQKNADLIVAAKLLKRICVDRRSYAQAGILRDIQNQTKRKTR